MEPCDARPDELRIAETIDRLAMLAPCLVPKTLRRTWAGLRTFAPDRVLVVGDDPLVKGFFWLAGQGGCGIETSPAVGQIAADLLIEGRTERYDATVLAPTRFVMSSGGGRGANQTEPDGEDGVVLMSGGMMDLASEAFRTALLGLPGASSGS